MVSHGHPGGADQNDSFPGAIRQVVGQAGGLPISLPVDRPHHAEAGHFGQRVSSELSLFRWPGLRISSTMPDTERCFTQPLRGTAEALLAHGDDVAAHSSPCVLDIAGFSAQQPTLAIFFPGGPSATTPTPIGLQTVLSIHP